MLVFLDFDGVLNSDMFFHKRTRFDTNEKAYRDYSESMLPFLDKEWFDSIEDESAKIKIRSFYKNICYTNYKNLLKLLDKLDNPEIVLSTSWRHGFNLVSWNALFCKLPGWKCDIVGKTGTNPNAGKYNSIQTGLVKEITIGEVMTAAWSRYDEIYLYVSAYASFKKEFPEYIILDDDHIFGTHNNNIGNTPFFRTRRWSGLTNRDIRKIMKHMKER